MLTSIDTVRPVAPMDWEQPESPRDLGTTPLLIYNEEWDTDEKAFLKFIQRLSDLLLARRRCLYHATNPNKPEAYGTLDGNLQADLYETASRIHGEEGFVVQRDYAFLHPTEQALRGLLAAAPFQPYVNNIDRALTTQKAWEQSVLGADMQLDRVLTGIEQQTSMDLSAHRPRRPLPQPGDELLSQLNEPDQMEMLITAGLREVDARYSFRQFGLEASRNLLAVNAEFAIIEDVGDTVRPVALHADQVSWIAARRLTDLEGAEAVAVADYLSPSELVALYGAELDADPGYDGVRKTLKKLTDNPQPLGPYDAASLHLGASGGITEYGGPQPGDQAGRPLTGIEWVTSDLGVPAFYYAGEGAPAVLRQRVWFRMIRPHRYKVLVKGANPTAEQKKSIRRSWTGKVSFGDITYVPVEKDDEKTDGEWVVQGASVEFWHFVRLGHSALLRCGRDERCPLITSDEPDVRGYPVVGRMGYERSVTTLAGFFAYVWNVGFNRVAELITSTGLSSALVIDPSQLPDGIDWETANYMARKLGVTLTEPQRKQGEQRPGENRHMTTINFNPSENDILRIITMLSAFQRIWAGLIGVPVEALAEAGGGGRLSPENAGALTQLFYGSHADFMQEVTRRVADRGRHAWAGEGLRPFDVGGGRRVVLRTRPDLPLGKFGLYLENSARAQKEKEFVLSLYPQILSGTISAEMWEKLFAYFVSENPAEGRAIFRTVKSDLEQMQDARAKAEQEIAAKNTETAARKVDIPILVAQMMGEYDLKKEAVRAGAKADATDAKGDIADIEAQRQGLAPQGRELLIDPQTAAAA